MKAAPKLKVVNAIEQGLGLTVLDIRRVKSGDDKNYYVATDNGLMQCSIDNRKVHYQYAVIAGEGVVEIPKLVDLKDPKEIKIVKEHKTYYAKELIEAGIIFKEQAPYQVIYKEEIIGNNFLDFLINKPWFLIKS